MPLTDAQSLALYDEGAARHAIDRALLLAAVADPAVDWADVPLGRRDAALLALRCDWCGPHFEAVQACPACGEPMSLALDLRALPQADAAAAGVEVEVEVAGARFRLPTTRDLAALASQARDEASAEDIDAAAEALLRRLALQPPPEGGWPAAQRAAVEAALDAADPLAHVALEARCGQCGHAWPAALDLASALWDEVAARARQAAWQVHLLASAYGWPEHEILAMPAARRELYLQQVVA